MKRILVCEDESIIREFVVLNLKRAGYTVREAACGEDALALFEQEGGRFDIAVLDIMMPGIDGFAVCRQLRAQSEIGIIMLSAKGQQIDFDEAKQCGADDYITKPFAPSELVERVHRLCAARKNRRQ